jgi:tetratricopeptide (TPR) repeat protein
MNIIIPNSKYNAALALMKSGKYEEAIEVFEKIEGYRDSEHKILECKYEEAESYVTQKNYKSAIDIFNYLNDYSDSNSRAEELSKNLYTYAKTYMSEGNYAKAIDNFDEIVDYSDSEKLISQCEIKLISSAQKGDSVSFGTYDDGTRISWKVLDKDEEKTLLISENIVDKKSFCESYSVNGVKWSNCTLRLWLNGEFEESAFSEYETDSIAVTNREGNIHEYYKSSEKIFLLSYSEAEEYFADDSARIAKDNTAISSEDVGDYWFLRDSFFSQANNILAVDYVDPNGKINRFYEDQGEGMNANAAIGIRPAMWINITDN